MSLDGVMQAPGGPDEDPTGGFTLGGWAANLFDDEMMDQMAESGPYELLLGRGTYEIFAAHWPYDEGPIADQLNGTRKHVASTTLKGVEWSNSTLIEGDVARVRPRAQGRGRPRDPGPRQPRPDPDAARARPGRRAAHLDLPADARHRASGCSATARSRWRSKLTEQQGLEDRRHDQLLRARRRDRHRLVRVRGADRGRGRAAQAPGDVSMRTYVRVRTSSSTATPRIRSSTARRTRWSWRRRLRSRAMKRSR